ncbi:hypothetical protein ADUPG1_006683, partial [Aduncisulcus paluster]
MPEFVLNPIDEFISVGSDSGFSSKATVIPKTLSISPKFTVQFANYIMSTEDGETYSSLHLVKQGREIGEIDKCSAFSFQDGIYTVVGSFFTAKNCLGTGYRNFSIDETDGSVTALTNNHGFPRVPGAISGVLGDGRFVLSTWSTTLAVPFSEFASLPIDVRREDFQTNAEYQTASSEGYTLLSSIETSWKDNYEICKIADYHNAFLAPNDGTYPVDIFSSKNSLYALPIGGTRAVRLALVYDGEDVVINSRGLSLVMCPIFHDGEASASSYTLFIGSSSSIIHLTIPSIDALEAAAATSSEDPFISVPCVIRKEFENVQVIPCSFPNHIVVLGKVSTKSEKYVECVKSSLEATSDILSIVSDGKM